MFCFPFANGEKEREKENNDPLGNNQPGFLFALYMKQAKNIFLNIYLPIIYTNGFDFIHLKSTFVIYLK